MIHNGWAFDPEEKRKSEENRYAFEHLEDKFHTLTHTPGYNHFIMNIHASLPFTGVEMLLWADNGNLCFGGVFNGNKDLNKIMPPGDYSVKIYTD